MTIDECFEAARKNFIKSDIKLVDLLHHEAAMHAQNIGLTEAQFCEVEINKHFAKYLTSFGEDPTVNLIRLMAPDDTSRKQLILEYYQTVAQNLGMSSEDYLGMNSISASDL